MSATARRRDALRAALREVDLEAILVTSLVNVRYLTGFTGSAGELLVTAAGGERFATDGRYTDQAAAELGDVDRVTVPRDGWIAEVLSGARRLGVESHVLPWDRARLLGRQLPGVEIVPAGPVVEPLRMRKDDEELGFLRKACAVGDRAFAQMLEWLRPGLTERDVGVRLDRSMVDLGATLPAFSTIVASGPNSAVPHHRPSGRVLERGDVVKFDFGALVAGYHADMTRMVALGHPDEPLASVFDVVRAAQQAGLDVVRDGAESAAVDDACRTVVTDAGYGDRFIHGTGHGVGLEIHEQPFVRPAPGTTVEAAVSATPSATLRERMTVTVEPGVYLPGVGGVRIEDSVAVTADGVDILTRTPKDLVVL